MVRQTVILKSIDCLFIESITVNRLKHLFGINVTSVVCWSVELTEQSEQSSAQLCPLPTTRCPLPAPQNPLPIPCSVLPTTTIPSQGPIPPHIHIKFFLCFWALPFIRTIILIFTMYSITVLALCPLLLLLLLLLQAAPFLTAPLLIIAAAAAVGC